MQLELGDQPVREGLYKVVTNREFVIPIGAVDFPVAARATAGVDLPVATLFSVFPHMHLLGRSIAVHVRRGATSPSTLIDIPVWDFGWQGAYQFEQPVALAAGDTLSVDCAYNNDGQARPSEVRYGPGASDEMCLAYLYMAP